MGKNSSGGGIRFLLGGGGGISQSHTKLLDLPTDYWKNNTCKLYVYFKAATTVDKAGTNLI